MNPLPEATRLLIDRGTGLLRARRVALGIDSPPDPHFVRRQAMRCALALGDAVLLTHRRYAAPLAGRGQHLRILDTANPEVERLRIRELYEAALQFELNPSRGAPATPVLTELGRRWSDVLLHVESRHSGRSFDSLAAYDGWLRQREEHGGASIVANLVHNARLGRLSLEHPLTQIDRELPVLLAQDDPTGPDWARRGARLLRAWPHGHA